MSKDAQRLGLTLLIWLVASGSLVANFMLMEDLKREQAVSAVYKMSLNMLRDREHTHVRYCWKQGEYWDCSDVERPWDEE